jgi:hypothetical protein
MDYNSLDEIIITIDNTCVICLELLDSSGAETEHKSKMTRTSVCDCNYHVHGSCFEQWLQDKPTDELNCLVCGSKMELVIPCIKQCEIYIKKYEPPKNILLLVSMGVIFIIYVFVNGPY